MEVTAQEVAEWMVKEIRFTGTLHQTAAIEYVKANFGEQFVFVNENGNASLAKDVKKRSASCTADGSPGTAMLFCGPGHSNSKKGPLPGAGDGPFAA